MGLKKLGNWVKKNIKPIAAVAAVVFPPLIPAIGTALGATGAATAIVGAAALSGAASAVAGDKPADILKNAALGGVAAGVTQAVSGSGLFGGGADSGVIPAGTSAGGTAPVEFSPQQLSELSGQVASQGLLGSVVNKVASLTGLTPDTIGKLGSAGVQALLSGYGSKQTAQQAQQAAQTQADAQIRAAQIAADAARFRPVGVTTRYGQSAFTTDAQGNVIGAGYTATPEIVGYQNRLSALAGKGLTQAEQAQAAYAPLQAGAQSLFGLGQNYLGSNLGQPLTSMGQTYMNSQVGQPLTNLGLGYLKQTPEQVAADYITKQQALLAPTQENQLALLQNKLQQQGRTGLSVAQGGNLGATTPEMQAYYNALAQSNLQLSANANAAGQQQAQFGAGLYGQGVGLTQAQQLAGANLYGQGINLTQQGQQFGGGLMSQGAGLQNAYYTGQTAAYAPFATAMDTSSALERLAQTPLNLGINIGGQTTAASADAGRLLSTGITNAASTMKPSNAYSASGNLFSGLAQNPMVTGAINNAFGVQSSAPKYQIINGQLVQVS